MESLWGGGEGEDRQWGEVNSVLFLDLSAVYMGVFVSQDFIQSIVYL